MKKIFIGASIFAIILGLLLFIGYIKAKKDSADINLEMKEGPAQISPVVEAYRVKYKKWPKNPEDIQKLIKDNKEFSDFDLNAYQGLKFVLTVNKVLTIRYESYKKGYVSTGPGQLDISIQTSK